MNTVDTLLPLFSALMYIAYAILFLIIAFIDKSKSFALFALCLVTALLSAVLDGTSGSTSSSLYIGASFFVLASTYSMLLGMCAMFQKKPSKWPLAYAIAALMAKIAATHFGQPFLISHLPITLAVAGHYAHTVYIIWTSRGAQRTFHRIAALLFAASGIYMLQYPFVRNHNTPVIFMTGILLIQFSLIATITLHFSVKNNVLEAARNTLEAYIQDSPIAILVTTADGIITKTNTAFQKLVSNTNDAILRASISTLFDLNNAIHTPDSASPSPQPMAREILVTTATGNRIPCRITATQQVDGTRILFFENIAEEKLNERSKNELQQLIFQSSHMASLGELAASVAHEINTPLAIVKSSAESSARMVKGSLANENILAQHIARIEAGARKIESIVRSMLSLSRKGSSEAATVDIGQTVSEALAFLNILLAKNQIKMEINVGESPLLAHVCLPEIGQIVTNLVTNARDALEHSPEKVIRVSCFEEGGKVLITVQDTGCGMLPHTAAKVFEKFYSTKAYGSGTGLGLPLSQQLAHKNGGTLTFETMPWRGTTFTLSLPLAHPSPAQAAPREPQNAPAENSKPPAKNVLLVDDEPTILEIMKEFCTSEGYNATCVSTLEEAKRAIATQCFSHVFTDYALEYGTGEDVIRECRKHYPRENCRVFVLSGYTKNENLDADGHIRKPFQFTEVANALKGCSAP